MMTAQNKKGFMLPDVMMAVFIIAVALTAMIAVIAPLYRSEIFKRDEIIATNLAQEEIELMHFYRDYAWTFGRANGFTDTNFLGDADGSPAKVAVCLDGSGIKKGCSSGAPVYMDSNGVYLDATVRGSVSGLTPTQFTRKVELEYVDVDTRKVTSTVMWGDHQVVITSNLTNWDDK